MDFYNTYILVTFGVKVLYFLCAIAIIILSKKPSNEGIVKNIKYMQHRLEFVFATLLSFLLIFLFFPLRITPIILDRETKVLLFAYGMIVLLNAEWEIFFKESPILKTLQNK